IKLFPVVDMRNSPVSEASTSGRSVEYEIRTSGSEKEVCVDQFLGFPGRLVSYPPYSDAFKEFCKARASLGGLKSQVTRKESLLDTITQEKTELVAVLEDFGISRKKRVNSRVNKVQKYQSTRLMTRKWRGRGKKERVEPEMSGVKVVEDQPVVEDDWKDVEEKARLAALHGEEETSRMAARLMKGICLGVEEERVELKRKKVKLEKNAAQLKSDLSKEGKRLEALKASQVVKINKLQAEAKVDLEEVVAERDRLGRHLMSKGYSEDEVDAIRADTYMKEDEDEEIEDVAIGIVDGLDGVSLQTVKYNQGDHKERPELENKEELKDIRLRIKDLEVELSLERETLTSLLSSPAELQVELELARLREDGTRQFNQEFTERRIKIEKINMEADMAHYHIPALERSEEGLNRSMAGLRDDFAKKMHKQEKIQSDLANSKSELGQLKKKLVDKDNELKGARDDLFASEVESQIKLDAALIRENGLERVIRGKEIVIKDKEELIKKIPDVEELNKEIEILRAQVVDLEATNRTESAKADKKVVENIAFTDRIDREMESRKARYKKWEDFLPLSCNSSLTFRIADGGDCLLCRRSKKT
ncbi:hypothetical protein GIB67_040582, partial [Kingdonia uniflora]